MKRIIIGIVILALMTQGCHHSANQSADINSENTPLLFYDDDNHFDYAYTLCYFTNKKYQSMDTSLYNGKYSSEFIGSYEKVQTSAFNLDQKFTFYNEKGIALEEKINQLYCGGNVIDDFSHVYAELEDTQQLKGHRWIGIYSTQNPYPRNPIYSDNSIEIDLDGNGQMDVIQWSFTMADSNNNADMMWNYNVIFEVNGNTFTYSNPTELPLEQSDLSIFTADINSDDRMEIIIYQKLMMIQSEIIVYEVKNGSLQTMFQYVINTGP